MKVTFPEPTFGMFVNGVQAFRFASILDDNLPFWALFFPLSITIISKINFIVPENGSGSVSYRKEFFGKNFHKKRVFQVYQWAYPNIL